MGTGDTQTGGSTAAKTPRRMGAKKKDEAAKGTPDAKAKAEAKKAEEAAAEEKKKAEAKAAEEARAKEAGAKPPEGGAAAGAPPAGSAPPKDADRALTADEIDLAKLGELGLVVTPDGDVETTPKILIYGDSGAGKTHFASTAKKVAFALFESQGYETIRRVNPKAFVPGSKKRVRNPEGKVVEVAAKETPRLRRIEDFERLLEAAASGRLREAGFDILAIDGLTELQQLLINEIVQEKARALAQAQGQQQKAQQGARRGQAPAQGQQQSPAPGMNAQGKRVPEMTKQDWGALAIRWRNLMVRIRDLPIPVVAFALTSNEKDEETGRRITLPKLQGSAQDSIASFFNVVGLIYKQTVGSETVRMVLLEGDDRYYTKGLGPVNGICVADLQAWLEALAGGEVTVRIDGARAPGQQKRRLARGGQASTGAAQGEGGDAGEGGEADADGEEYED